MFWKRNKLVDVVTSPVFNEEQRRWIESTVNNPIFEKVMYGLLVQSLTEEHGVFKKSLSPEEVESILRYQNIYRDVLGDIKSDMIDYSKKEEVVEDETSDDPFFVPHPKDIKE